MSNNFTEISVSARFSSLSPLMCRVSEQAAQAGLDEAAICRLQLVLEELFTNTITHGYGSECDELVSVKFTHADGHCSLRYWDNAPVFDLSKTPLKDASTSEFGGLGLTLVHSMSKKVIYGHSGNRNIVLVTF